MRIEMGLEVGLEVRLEVGLEVGAGACLISRLQLHHIIFARMGKREEASVFF